MKIPGVLAVELWRLGFLVAGSWLLGAVIGHPQGVAALGMLVYVLALLRQLGRLANWVEAPEHRPGPTDTGIVSDIHARMQRMRKRAQQRESRLQTELDQFRASAAALPDAVVALDHAGYILWFNDNGRTLLGLRDPQDRGQRLVNLYRSPDLTAFLRNRNFASDLVIAAPVDRSRTLSIRVTLFAGGRLLLVAQDVTARYRIEQIRRDFAANVSHELRTPLTVISGFVENMRYAEDEVPKQWRKPLQLIAEQSERMRHIVEDLLLLARLESAAVDTKREPVDVAELAKTIAADAINLSDADLEIKVQVDSVRLINGDAGLLRSAFTNLVVNALAHTPPGGLITLTWSDRDNRSCFEVRDTGEGIAEEHLPRLTERFYRVDDGRSRARGGTGLGLAIVKHVLQLHAAHLEIESELGEGSRFGCCFPPGRLSG